MDLKAKLSPHFTLGELVRTSHRSLDNKPPQEVIERLTKLCNDFLEPIRNKFGPIRVNSGYRSPAVNKAVGGSKKSAHLFGCAADLDPLVPDVSIRDIVTWIVKESGLPYDQVIEEYSSTASWVHIGMLRPGFEENPRKDSLIFIGGQYHIWK